MKVDQEKCIGCGICLVYCPVDAIHMADGKDGKKTKAEIDQDTCVECGNCIRPRTVPCPTSSFYELPKEERSVGRQLRRFFSDPSTTHPLTGVPGRGTEEVKTNDVTGRVCRGELGICLEMGRPVVGTTISEIEKITMHLAKLGIKLEDNNPLIEMIEDAATGKFKPEFAEERFVSAIVEFVVPSDRGREMLLECKRMADEVDTVFSLDLVCCYDEDMSIPVLGLLEEIEMMPRENAKVNVGIGRPYKIER
jgi:NAD-dependent dihydropyrimidine dehydrogenase PreA subunit